MKNKLLNIGVPLALILLIVGLVVAAIVKHQGQEKDAAVAVTVPVELSASEQARSSSIGLILTVGNEGAQGSEWNQAAAGAQVAIERFNRSGTNLTLITEDDRGTSAGAARAVEVLAQQNVSGVVIASRGNHVEEAVKAAEERGIPVILPYADAVGGAWSLAPSPSDVTSLLESHYSGTSRVVRIDQEGFPGPDVRAEETVTVNSSSDLNKTAQDLASSIAKEDTSTAIFINADSYLQARLTRALQEAGAQASIVLGNEATSPAFSETFTRDNPSTVINATTVGFNTGDSVALQANGQGRSMSAYLQMVKMLGDSPDAHGPVGEQPFSDVAASADARSHDAVVALVRATEKAPSAKPEDVKKELGTLTLSPSDGITAAGLDFSQPHAVAGSPALLSATLGDVTIRTSNEDESAHIVWFAAS